MEVQRRDSRGPGDQPWEESGVRFEEAGRSQGLQACGEHGEDTEVSRSVILKPDCTLDPSGGAGVLSGRLEWGLRACMFNAFSGDADAAGPAATLGEPQLLHADKCKEHQRWPATGRERADGFLFSSPFSSVPRILMAMDLFSSELVRASTGPRNHASSAPRAARAEGPVTERHQPACARRWPAPASRRHTKAAARSLHLVSLVWEPGE